LTEKHNEELETAPHVAKTTAANSTKCL